MKLSEFIKLNILKRLPAIIGAGVIATLFSLYYVGLFDISFIERPDDWKNNLNLFSEVINGENVTEDSSKNEQEKPEPEENKTENDKKPNKKPNKKPERVPVTNAPQMLTFKTVAELRGEGYYLTDKVFDESCVFAKLTPEYAWPDEFSSSNKAYDKEVVTHYEDGTESTVETVRYSGQRAALELYMGYIIYDNDGELLLIGPDGTVLTGYNDKEFIPAYTRDLEGRPLFYKKKTVKEKYPTVLGKEDKDGNKKWDKTAELKIEDREYYYLAADGKTFKKAEYNDATDNRGLYFDYPSYYGSTDSKFSRYYLNTTKFFTTLEGETSVIDDVRWAFSKDKLDLSLFKFDKEGLLITDIEENKKPKNELFPYTHAYNYSEKYATVFMDIEWSYDHDMEHDGIDEIKTYEMTTNELRVIDENGEVMFESRKNFFSDIKKWTAHERFVRPLLSGIDSIGSYYFDHGLMRLRIQTWDCYYQAQFDTVKIVTDEDVLVNHKGERFTLPTGYNLISYSDGIILLEKDGKFGYMNYLSNWIRDPELLDAEPFLEGVAVCKNSEGYYGVIDTDGNAVIPFDYKYISNISGGTLVAFNETIGWTVYQKLTK